MWWYNKASTRQFIKSLWCPLTFYEWIFFFLNFCMDVLAILYDIIILFGPQSYIIVTMLGHNSSLSVEKSRQTNLFMNAIWIRFSSIFFLESLHCRKYIWGKSYLFGLTFQKIILLFILYSSITFWIDFRNPKLLSIQFTTQTRLISTELSQRTFQSKQVMFCSYSRWHRS